MYFARDTTVILCHGGWGKRNLPCTEQPWIPMQPMLKRQVLLSARSKNKKTPLSFGLYFLASSLPPVILVFLVFCHFPCVSCAPLFVSFAMRGCVTVWCWRGPSIHSPDRWSSRSPSKSVLSSTLQYFYPPGSSLTSSTDRRFDPSG